MSAATCCLATTFAHAARSREAVANGRQDRWLEAGKLKTVPDWALQCDARYGKRTLDEERAFIRDEELFG